jgi:hypothetical protein
MHQESWDPLTAILQPSLIFKFNYGTDLGEIAATFITSSIIDSIDQTLMATTTTHAIRPAHIVNIYHQLRKNQLAKTPITVRKPTLATVPLIKGQPLFKVKGVLYQIKLRCPF